MFRGSLAGPKGATVNPPAECWNCGGTGKFCPSVPDKCDGCEECERCKGTGKEPARVS